MHGGRGGYRRGPRRPPPRAAATVDATYGCWNFDTQDDIESALKQAEREAENTTLAKFFRNLESRIYAQLSKQLVENLFATCDPVDITCTQTSFGSFVLEGNAITYQKTTCDSSLWACTQDEEVIVMTIVGEDGTETIIVIPIGAGSSGGG